MVFIFGGGFSKGSNRDIYYNGKQLAIEQNVVVVVINYRLGYFGFMMKDENGKGGNNGFKD